VEARFKYIPENIKTTDAVVVGMWDRYFDECAINKEYLVKYSNTSWPQAPGPRPPSVSLEKCVSCYFSYRRC